MQKPSAWAGLDLLSVSIIASCAVIPPTYISFDLLELGDLGA